MRAAESEEVVSIAYPRWNAFHPEPKSLAGLFEIVALLSQASQGSITLTEMLRRMGSALGTDATAMCRVDLSASHDAAKVICHDSGALHSEYTDPINVSFALGVTGRNFKAMKAGSVRCGGLDDFGDRVKLAGIFRSRRLEETVVINLRSEGGCTDFLELHFSHSVPEALLAHFENLGPVLAECWGRRSLGVFSEAMLSRRQALETTSPSDEILSMDNPFALSRAEYRVCLLLSRGLSNKDMLSELSISIGTLRTHLSNIYAKTDCASQMELIQKLLNPATHRGGYQQDAAYVA